MTRLALAFVLGSTLVGCYASGEDGPRPLDPSERLPGGATTNTFLLGSNAFTMPAENASAEHETAFYSGNSFFNENWVEAPSSTTARDGLGPLYNARSCASCHFKDGRGRPPLEADEGFVGLLLRLSVPGQGEHGEPLPEPKYGGQLQPYAVGDLASEGTPRVRYEIVTGEYADGEAYELTAPIYEITDLVAGPLAEDTLISPRVAPAVVGLGLLEAISAERLEELADPEDADGDGISGRINRVWDVKAQDFAIGRFGWKAEQPSVLQQSAGAFNGDIGISSALFPGNDCQASEGCAEAPNGGDPEIETETLDRVGVYARLLAVPVRERWDDDATRAGRDVFFGAGCGSCHVPSHVTGDYAELSEVEHQTIWPYTDLLLHDMGDELDDGRPSFDAKGKEWRTPPLWGLRFYEIVNGHDRLLHDGRARGVAEAILWHGGEAESAREAFRRMKREDRTRLVEFVESL
ncbi:MAG TPA: di-heme oxidoredictase family protein [Polyangiaceae bacterium]